MTARMENLRVARIGVLPAANASEDETIDKTARVDIVEYTWEEALDAMLHTPIQNSKSNFLYNDLEPGRAQI